MTQGKSIKVILNADDFGAYSQVNRSIISLFKCNKITSATVMANGPVFSEAVDFMTQYPQHSYGIHLNITEFSPLTKNKEGLRGFMWVDIGISG